MTTREEHVQRMYDLSPNRRLDSIPTECALLFREIGNYANELFAELEAARVASGGDEGLPDRAMALREFLAALAGRRAREMPLPEGIVCTVIVTDQDGAFVGVGTNAADNSYRDAMIACAAGGADRVDHFDVDAGKQACSATAAKATEDPLPQEACDAQLGDEAR